MLSSNKINRTGIEVNELFIGRLTDSDLKNGYILVPLYLGSFTELGNGIKREFQSILENSYSNGSLPNPTIGYVINSGKHYFYLAINESDIDSNISSQIYKQFKERFNSKSFLEITTLDSNGELQQNLIEKGTKLFNKNV